MFRSARLFLIAAAGIAIAGAGLMPSPAAAQQPDKPAAPRRPPQTQNQPKEQDEAVKPREVSGLTLGWIKHCAEVGTPPSPACVTQQEVRNDKGDFIAALALEEPAGNARKRLAILVPLGGWLPSELGLRIDDGKRIEAKYDTCLANGCFASLTATPDLLKSLRGGKTVTVTLIEGFSLQPIDLKVPLDSFVAAVDGAPADPAQSEEIHKQWINSLAARAEARRNQSLNPPPAQDGTTQVSPPAALQAQPGAPVPQQDAPKQ